MIAIVGTVSANGIVSNDAKVQVLIRDVPNDTFVESEVFTVTDDGKFQFSLWGDLKLHDGLSNQAEVLVVSWRGGETRLDEHSQMIAKTIPYNGGELILVDLELKNEYNDLLLENDTLQVAAGRPFVYTPELVHSDQPSTMLSKNIFPIQKIKSVLFSDGSTSKFGSIYNTIGEQTVSFSVVLFSGAEKTFETKITVVEDEVITKDLVDIDITSGMAFFVGKEKGIKNNSLEVLMTFSDRIIPIEVRFYSDGSLLSTLDDFTSASALMGVPMPSGGVNSIIRMETTAIHADDGTQIELEYEQDMIHYSFISGEVVVSLDPETGKHTAVYNFDHASEIVSVLWQIVYKSVVIEKIIDIAGAEEKGFVNILYQDYVTPDNNTIEFETLQPGGYEVHAYAINHAGRFFDASTSIFVPGGTQGDDDQLVIGDSIPIGCLSRHGEVPILEIYALTRANGWEAVESLPMNHTHDKTYMLDYTLSIDNAYYIFKVADVTLVKRVGAPIGIFLALPKIPIAGREVSYTIEDFNGGVIAEGQLDDSGVGAYYKVASENTTGVLVVSGTRKIV